MGFTNQKEILLGSCNTICNKRDPCLPAGMEVMARVIAVRVHEPLRICHGCSICKNWDELIEHTVGVMLRHLFVVIW